MTTTEIAIRRDTFTRDQIELLKRTICAGATDDELRLFTNTAERLQLDPFARQVFAVKRWDAKAGREVMAIQVSIDGFRLVAERTGKYAGQLGPFWSADGDTWREVWLSDKPPAAAKVAVLRHDFKEPVWAVATWDQYKQEGKNGLTPMWRKMGPLMLGKCAESLALRKAFPNELSGAYTAEEMAQATPADSTPTYEPPAATKPARANTVKHDGQPASKDQIAKLHVLKGKVGGLTDDMYRKQLAAFKDADGNPCQYSNELSNAQISNLIDRYEAKIQQQEKRAAEVPDIGAVVPPTAPLGELLERAFPPADEQADWLMGLWGVQHIKELNEKESSTALQLLIAMSQGESEYDATLVVAREKGLCR